MSYTLGDFELLEEIGRGGMGVVYRARQRSLGRIVAVKVLPEALGATGQVAQRFRTEAQRMAQLTHPNIASVYVVGEQDGVEYFAMQHLPGGSLETRLRHERPSLDVAVEIAAQVAEALDYAHERGVIHRDIKPSNVMFDEHGRPVVTDFGIAKAADGSQMTATGTLIGTPQYMAPEQARGNPLDGRADLYALGVVLYEMLCGQPPFDADTPLSVAMKQINDPPLPPRMLCPSLPDWLEGIVLKALAKQPADRFARGADMAAALRSGRRVGPFAEHALPSGPPDPRPPGTVAIARPTSPAVGSAVVAIILACLIVGVGVIVAAMLYTSPSRSSAPRPEPVDATGRNGMDGAAKGPPAGGMLLSVPGVIGLESNDARHTLEGAGLKVSVAYQESAEEQRGKVVGQQPGPDSQAPTGTEVALVVGAGVGEVQIPYELDGKPVEEVERTLHELGLVTTRADVERDGCREGTVFAFEPPRGTHVPKGSTVRLSVAKAPQRQPVDSSSILGSWRLSSPNTDSAWDFRADGTATWTEPSTGDTRVWHWRIENGTLRLEFDPSKIVYYEVWFQGPKLHWRSLDGAKHYVFGRR